MPLRCSRIANFFRISILGIVACTFSMYTRSLSWRWSSRLLIYPNLDARIFHRFQLFLPAYGYDDTLPTSGFFPLRNPSHNISADTSHLPVLQLPHGCPPPFMSIPFHPFIWCFYYTNDTLFVMQFSIIVSLNCKLQILITVQFPLVNYSILIIHIKTLHLYRCKPSMYLYNPYWANMNHLFLKGEDLILGVKKTFRHFFRIGKPLIVCMIYSISTASLPPEYGYPPSAGAVPRVRLPHGLLRSACHRNRCPSSFSVAG